jgi:hypothetical protein
MQFALIFKEKKEKSGERAMRDLALSFFHVPKVK